MLVSPRVVNKRHAGALGSLFVVSNGFSFQLVPSTGSHTRFNKRGEFLLSSSYICRQDTFILNHLALEVL